MIDPAARIAEVFSDHLAVVSQSKALQSSIAEAAHALTECLVNGGTILLCGNGGSAADAQHLAGEWVGRFQLERRGLPAIALHANSTALTAIANDFGFDDVFARQVEAHGRAGDVLIAISTSGSSVNVVRASERARSIGLKVIGMTGLKGGPLADLSDVLLAVPSDVTARVQEVHILIGHLLCELSELGWQERQV